MKTLLFAVATIFTTVAAHAQSDPDFCRTILQRLTLESPQHKNLPPIVTGHKGTFDPILKPDGPNNYIQHKYAEPNPTISSVRIAAVVPDYSSFQNVFANREATRGAVRELDNVAEQFGRVRDASVCRSAKGIELLAEFEPAGNGDVIILIGHSRTNLNGEREFVFPDGSAYTFAQVHTYARKLNVHLIIESCYSNVAREVSFKEAVRVVERLQMGLPGTQTKDQLIALLEAEHKRVEVREAGLKASVVVASGGAGGLLAGGIILLPDGAADDDEDEKSFPRP